MKINLQFFTEIENILFKENLYYSNLIEYKLIYLLKNRNNFEEIKSIFNSIRCYEENGKIIIEEGIHEVLLIYFFNSNLKRGNFKDEFIKESEELRDFLFEIDIEQNFINKEGTSRTFFELDNDNEIDGYFIDEEDFLYFKESNSILEIKIDDKNEDNRTLFKKLFG